MREVHLVGSAELNFLGGSDTPNNRKAIAARSLIDLVEQDADARGTQSVAEAIALRTARTTAETAYVRSPRIVEGRESRVEQLIRYGFGWQCLVSWNTKAMSLPLVEVVVVTGDDGEVKTAHMLFNRSLYRNSIPPFTPETGILTR